MLFKHNMKITAVLLLGLLGLALGRVSYKGYKTYEVLPKDQEQLDILASLRKDKNYDFWTRLYTPNKPLSIMVTPSSQKKFEKILESNKIEFRVQIEDVEEIALRDQMPRVSARKAGEISFDKYYQHAEINAYLDEMVAKYPDKAKIDLLGQSLEGRDMKAIRISSGGKNKPAIFIDAGIHAREWIAPPVALYTIQQLLENPEAASMTENVDWVIIPSLNPDGYQYTFDEDRFWRKTRSPGFLCYGVDPNRNFGFHWNENGASDFECDETYAGKKAFSEIETTNLRDYFASHDNFKLYLTFHSYGQYLLYPWGYTSALPDDVQELDDLAHEVNDAIEAVRGTSFTIGSSTNVLYAAAGGSDDFAKGVAGIQLSYTIELPGGGSGGFDPPESEIEPVVKETWEGIKVYHKHIEDKFGAK